MMMDADFLDDSDQQQRGVGVTLRRAVEHWDSSKTILLAGAVLLLLSMVGSWAGILPDGATLVVASVGAGMFLWGGTLTNNWAMPRWLTVVFTIIVALVMWRGPESEQLAGLGTIPTLIAGAIFIVFLWLADQSGEQD